MVMGYHWIPIPTVLFLCLLLFFSLGDVLINGNHEDFYEEAWMTSSSSQNLQMDEEEVRGLGLIPISIPTQQPTKASASHGIPISQYLALQTMYNELDGDSWTWNEDSKNSTKPWSFTSSTVNPCLDDWQGITCNSRCSRINLPCYITELDLSKHNLTGSLPNGLFPNLTTLTVLDLSLNKLHGTIPADLGTLSSLQSIKLYLNVHINGTLPDNLFMKMTKTLTFADFSQNFLNGTIPSSIYDCRNLTHLDFGKNLFRGPISNDICQLKNVEFLALRSNNLVGTIPSCIGETMTNLTRFYLNINHLTGSFPSTLTQLPNLKLLVFSHNNLTGPLPAINETRGDWSNIIQFDVWDNQLDGSISAELVTLPKLQVLNLAENHFTSTIPNEISEAVNLNGLILQANLLTGTVPNLENLTELFAFVVTENLLHGDIAPMPHTPITFFSAGVNALDGILPMEFNHSHLLLYFVSDAFFTGQLPDNLEEKPINLVTTIQAVLNIDANRIDIEQAQAVIQYILGENVDLEQTITDIQNFLDNLDDVMFYFATSNNLLTGTVPAWTTQSPFITYLSLDHNFFHGTIPDFTTKSIVSFSVQDNLLTGTIPNTVDALLNVVTFQASDNQLVGTVPLTLLTTSTKLQNVLLQSNALTGHIPDIVKDATPIDGGSQISLTRVDGADPQDVISYVVNFDISGNQISGTMPETLFTHFPMMSVFSAASNCLTGSLPDRICEAPLLSALTLDGMSSASSCRLKIFPFSEAFVLRHTIKGSIPPCIFNMRHMESLHLSGNGLSGSLSSNIQNISLSLIDLEISHNFLTGDIPTAIQRHSWETLDLSYNKFEGTFEEDINFPVNSTFYADVNRLSGDIPNGLLNVLNIEILNGNVFNCNIEKTNLPEHDPKASSYECGSDSVNQSLAAWLLIPLLCLALICLVKMFCWKNEIYRKMFVTLWDKKKVWNHALLQDYYAVVGSNGVLSLTLAKANASLNANTATDRYSTMSNMATSPGPAPAPSPASSLMRPSELMARSSMASTAAMVSGYDSHGFNLGLNNNHPSGNGLRKKKLKNPFKEMRRFFEHFRMYTAMLTGLAVIVMMPLFVLLSAYERTYEYQYAWEFSAAYLTGLASGLGLLAVFSILLISMYYLFNVKMRWIFNVFGIVDMENLANEELEEKRQIFRRSSHALVSSTATGTNAGNNPMLRPSMTNEFRDDSMTMMSASMFANPYSTGQQSQQHDQGFRSSSASMWYLNPSVAPSSRPSMMTSTQAQAQQAQREQSPLRASTLNRLSPSHSPIQQPQYRKQAWNSSPSQEQSRDSMASNVGYGGMRALNLARPTFAAAGQQQHPRDPSIMQSRASESRPSILMPDDVRVVTDRLELAKLTVTGTINTIIMMTMNVLYVLAVLYVQSTLLITMSQIILAVAKLYWNNIAIWQILKKCKKELHKWWKLDKNSFKLITTEDVFAIALMIFFNNIIAPCISIMLVNPSCFYHAFAPAPSVHSTYTYCSRYFRFARQQDVCFGTSTGESSYDPAFFYSYNCASSMPWNYAAVYIYMMLISGVLVPIGQLTGKYIYDHLNEETLLFKYLDKTLPRFWRKLRPLEDFVIKVKVKSRKQNANATQGQGQVVRGSEMETLKGRDTESMKPSVSSPANGAVSPSSSSVWFAWLPWMSSKSSVGSGSTETTPTASFSSSSPSASFSSGGRSSGGTVVGTGSIANSGEVEMLPLRHSKIMAAGQGANLEKEEVIVQGEKKFRVKYPQILHKGKIIVRLMGFFAILVSFGVIFPPLAAMSCVTIAFWSYFLQVHVGRVLVEAKALQYTHYIVQLYRDCDYIVNLIIPTILPLMFITSMLLGFLVFDTIGDAEGHRVATAPAVFLVIFPAIIWLFGKVNWNEVYRRIYWTVHSWIFTMDPDMMARLKALQLERELQAQEEEAAEAAEAQRLMQEHQGSMMFAKTDRDSRMSSMSPSIVGRASTAMIRPTMTGPLKPIQSTTGGGRSSYFMNKTVVDVDDGSDSEEEEDEDENEENDAEGMRGDAGFVENTSIVEQEGLTNNPLHPLV